jgi:glutamine amidotransferase-like uncharacterized protein
MRFPFFSAGASRCIILIAVAIVLPITLTGCGSSAFSNPGASKAPTASMLAKTPSVPPILLFNGTGTLAADVSAWETILQNLKLSYATANSSQMNSMSETTLKTYKLLIVPGGNSATIGNNLKKTTTANIYNAVQGGLHYLGICAGGFFGGYSIYNGLNLTSGVGFNVYKNGGKGIGISSVEISYPQTQLDQLWEDGPEFAGWGTIAAKYPDGTPAVVEGKSGSGWIILCGFHPEAPASWRGGLKFTTSAAVDQAYAGTLVSASLNGTWLPHY